MIRTTDTRRDMPHLGWHGATRTRPATFINPSQMAAMLHIRLINDPTPRLVEYDVVRKGAS